MGERRYLVAVCSAIVLGAVLFWIGGVLIGLAMLELEENRKMFLLRGPGAEATAPSLDWRLVCAGLAVFASGLCLMVLTQISIFKRTYVHTVSGTLVNYGASTAQNVEVRCYWYSGGVQVYSGTIWIGNLYGRDVKAFKQTFYFNGQATLSYQIAWD